MYNGGDIQTSGKLGQPSEILSIKDRAEEVTVEHLGKDATLRLQPQLVTEFGFC